MSSSEPEQTKEEVLRPELGGGFTRRAVIWISVIAVGSFVVAVLLMAFGEDLGRKPTAQANTFSYSLMGHRALTEFLKKHGVGVLARQTRAGIGTGPDTPLILAEPFIDWLREDKTRRIPALQEEARRKDAAFVLVLPKWKGVPSREKKGWLAEMDLLPDGEVESVLQKVRDPSISSLLVRRPASGVEGTLICKTHFGGTRLEIDVSPAQLLPYDSDFEPVVSCGTEGVLIARRFVGPEGPDIYLVSDPDLLNNMGLGRADNALAVRLLIVNYLQAKGVVFDETIHGFVRSSGLLYEVTRFPLVLAVMASLFFMGIVLWAGMVRFGKPLERAPGLEAAGKDVLVDNTAKLLSFGGHSGEGLRHYYEQTVRAVAVHFFLRSDLSEADRLSQLETLAKNRSVELNLAAMKRRVDHATGISAERAVRIAMQLYQWRLQMTEAGDIGGTDPRSKGTKT